jgi:hypothetical protein
MFAFRIPASARLRFYAVRQLYQKFLSENSREARGLWLMRDWLSPSQRLQFDRSGSFDVIGCDSGKRYRVYSERVPNVHKLDDAGWPVVRLVFRPFWSTANWRCNACSEDCVGDKRARRVRCRQQISPGPHEPAQPPRHGGPLLTSGDYRTIPGCIPAFI